MRKALVLLLTLFSMSAFADTVAVEQLLYGGVSQVEELNLSTEKTKTLYRNVEVPAICYRTEMQYRCHAGPQRCIPRCDRPGGCRTICTPGPRICDYVPVSVPYACTRIERQAYQVHDYYVETNVQFQFNNSEVIDAVNEKLIMTVNGDTATLRVEGSDNYFLMLDNKTEAYTMEGGVKKINLVYKISLIPTATARNVLSDGIQNVSYRNGILNFTLGSGFNFEEFAQNIKIFRSRRLRSDILLLNRELGQNEINVQSTENASHMSIDLNSLGILIPSSVRVILDTKYLIDESRLLNKTSIKLSAHTNWIFR